MSETKTERDFEVEELKREIESLSVNLKRESSRNDILIELPKLYYRYKTISDDDIRKHLETISIVIAQHKGVGTEFGYYPLNKKSMDKIRKKPRNFSLTFDATETSEKIINGLKEYKKINYLVKSTSRFFLKPDIGEIIDQIEFDDLHGDKIKAICFDSSDHENLPGTDGEHFLMQATLLCEG